MLPPVERDRGLFCARLPRFLLRRHQGAERKRR